MHYSLTLIIISLLVLTSIDRFVGVNAEDSDKAIDSRAVSILRGTITHVRDGDTFEVQGTPVRISALDCPENSTSSGQKATRFTKQFKGKQAVCELTGAKTYDLSLIHI